MKKMLLFAVAMVLVASVASALTIVGSAHDMRTHISNETSTQVCVYCHTPHMSAGRTQDPLWNHSLSTVTSYGVYSSATMNVAPTELAGSGSSGLLCMSCHDGTVAVNSLWKQPGDGNVGSSPVTGGVLLANMAINSSASGYIGNDLTNDHPVNFSYNASITGGDNDLRAAPTGSIVLFAGSVQCGSCHNVHDPAFPPFLRQTNGGSAVCLACHDK
jgi:predicted CXXCH cytochrome family protein